jgi:formylglycine-generating enzyme required for sulfatase activity
VAATCTHVAQSSGCEARTRRRRNRRSRPARFVIHVSAITALVGGLGFAVTSACGDPLPTFRDAFKDKSGRSGPEMVALPGGAVRLGEPVRAAVLSPFAIARDDVTNEEFTEFLNEKGDVDSDRIAYLVSRNSNAIEISKSGGRFRVMAGRNAFPVTGVSWRGAIAYALWLSERTGQRYFLPTEAQWEYAARAGTETTFPWGDAFDPAAANCDAPHGVADLKPVGSYPPNPFGLRDMVGNVWQWVADCFPEDPADLSEVDPSGFDARCVTPSIRGGAAASAPLLCQPDFRVNYWWRGSVGHLGFRVVRLGEGGSSP